MTKPYTYLIIGSGIIGMSIALALKERQPDASVLILEKEADIAAHASGRNSGVLHAGFYYAADSLKARLTVAGNMAMKQFCREHGLAVNDCGKLVVAQNEDEVPGLYELEKRGKRNGSNVRLIDAAAAKEIDPNVKTCRYALYSPDTASIDPVAVCRKIKEILQGEGVEFRFCTKYLGHRSNTVVTTTGEVTACHIINCAGLYADRVAQDFGFGDRYTMIPFKGLYLKYTKNTTDVKVNIYPVPNLKNPFLGVHFTKTVDGAIKIGPTAIPAFWRENYEGIAHVSLSELAEIAFHESRLFLTNAFGFRTLANEEMKKYNKDYFIRLAMGMVEDIDPAGFTEFTRPGIRAQLLDKSALTLVQDFVVEGDRQSTHVLNAVSPAFTCAFPFASLVVRDYIAKKP